MFWARFSIEDIVFDYLSYYRVPSKCVSVAANILIVIALPALI